jgi:hypothetical protein
VKNYFVSSALVAALFALSSASFGQQFSSIERTDFGSTPQGTLPSACNADDAVSQALVAGGFSSAFTSDAVFDLLTADNATAGGASATFPAGEVVTEVVLWGIQLEFEAGVGFVGACDPNQADFTIGTWTDAGGAPDTLIDSATATPTVTDTGLPFALGATVQEVRLQVPAGIDSDGATWFSVQREASPPTAAGNACAFLWVNTTDTGVGDNQSLTIDIGAGSVIARTEDTSACVTTGQGLPETQPVPTNSPWALALLLVALAGFGLIAVRRFA